MSVIRPGADGAPARGYAADVKVKAIWSVLAMRTVTHSDFASAMELFLDHSKYGC